MCTKYAVNLVKTHFYVSRGPSSDLPARVPNPEKSTKIFINQNWQNDCDKLGSLVWMLGLSLALQSRNTLALGSTRNVKSFYHVISFINSYKSLCA